MVGGRGGLGVAPGVAPQPATCGASEYPSGLVN